MRQNCVCSLCCLRGKQELLRRVTPRRHVAWLVPQVRDVWLSRCEKCIASTFCFCSAMHLLKKILMHCLLCYNITLQSFQFTWTVNLLFQLDKIPTVLSLLSEFAFPTGTVSNTDILQIFRQFLKIQKNSINSKINSEKNQQNMQCFPQIKNTLKKC